MKNMFNIRHYISAGSAAAVCLGFLAFQAANGAESEKRGQLTASEYKFVTEAVQGGTTEVTLGQLAVEKAVDPEVRKFGERMVQDHQKANQELTDLITKKGAALPETTPKKEERTVEKLRGLTGADFDRAYVKAMVSDHKKDVKEFQKQAEKAEDPELKNWVTKTLPTLQEHLTIVQSLEAKVVATR